MTFNGPSQRFDQRFAFFHNTIVKPEPLNFETYIQTTDVSTITSVALLQAGADTFGLVRCGVVVM